MLPSAISSSLLCLLLLFLHSPCATAYPSFYDCSSLTSSYTANSTFESNLNLLLSNLTSINASRSGFSTAIVGQIPDRVYGLVLCRGDTNAGDCSSCISTAAGDILQVCPYERDATVWYDPCLLRYSNEDFLAYAVSAPSGYSYEDPVTDPGPFDALLKELVERISDWAAYNSTRRFATGEASCKPAVPAVYALVQCTPDQSGSQCRQCLQVLMEQNWVNFYGTRGGETFGVRCNLRFESYSFFSGAPTFRLASPSACVPMPAAAPPQLRPLYPPSEGDN